MRTIWRFEPGIPGYGVQISDFCASRDHLYYVTQFEVGCVAKRSGKALWRHRFVSNDQLAHEIMPPEDRKRLLAADGSRFYAAESQNVWSQPTPGPCRLTAYHSQTGEIAWVRSLDSGASHAPCPAGDKVLAATSRGTVYAFRQRDGALLWKRALVAPPASSGQSRDIQLHAAGGVGVAMIGAGKLAGFRLRDGKPLWTYPVSNQPGATPADGNSEGFVLQGGTVYACLDGAEMVALHATTGRRIWRWQTSSNATPTQAPRVLADRILLESLDGWKMLRRADGHEIPWSMEAMPGFWWLTPARGQSVAREPGGRTALLMTTLTGPLIDGILRHTKADDHITDLAVFDISTGRALWRWQPETGFEIDKLIVEGDRLYISDLVRLREVEPGPPVQLPSDHAARVRLAYGMAAAQFGDWWLKGAGVTSIPSFQTDERQADLTLLRLGKDSIPALLDFAAQQATRWSGWRPPSEFEHALELLVDIYGPSATVPYLTRTLTGVSDTWPRGPLVRTLIELGDPRAAPALFQYAQSAGEPDREREDALYFVCRHGAQIVPPAEVTAYLERELTKLTTPGWLHTFAMFELLNDRGKPARAAALAAFHTEKTAHLLPPNITLTNTPNDGYAHSHWLYEGFPAQIDPVATSKDVSGVWWAAFYCSYLASMPRPDYHIWFAQSVDGQHWTRPAFGFDVASVCSPHGYPSDFKLTCSGGDLHLDIAEEVYNDAGQSHTFPHHLDIPIADLYRDSDGDGLPDRLEKLIGTDPHKADTNGNGLPDGEDKNPLYVEHKLTDEEAIYQTVIEALCQLGRLLPEDRENVVQTGPPELPLPLPGTDPNTPVTPRIEWWSAQAPGLLGRSSTPLFLPLPPGSAGIPLYGHPGMVFCRPLSVPDNPYQDADGPEWRIGGRFVAPHIDLEGRCRERDRGNFGGGLRSAPRTSKLAPLARQQELFRYFFPVVLTHDGTRARVGWLRADSPYGTMVLMGGYAGFDIEVRKIDGNWYPVECRAVYWGDRHSDWHVTVPISPDSGLK
jgi:outer membrane protein assembly factor BamB